MANTIYYDLSGAPATALSGLPDFSKPFTVLGIETSCDDTGVAIVRSDGKILSNIVMSQVVSMRNHLFAM
jgi:N6-L-threonylcarbamoyladenine synthase